MPGSLALVVFFTIPGVLFFFLAFSVFNLIRDLIFRRAGSKFQTRLFAYFIVIVMFASAPVTVITIQSVYEMVRFWRAINVEQGLLEARRLTIDNYTMQLERFERIIGAANFETALSEGAEYPEELNAQDITAVEDFRLGEDGVWTSAAFAGDPLRILPRPPAARRGFAAREIPRDTDAIRYTLLLKEDTLRVVTCDLGAGFDRTVEIVEAELARFEVIDSLRLNMAPLLAFYYGVFFLPTLLMTVIIAISFSRRVTQPIVELTEATRRVAEGNFSIQIVSLPGDELGLLISSFNAMVRDLEKTRSALVKAEKISIWQSMAQQLAHEIKNPLTPIKLSAERVLRRWRNDPGRVGDILEDSMLAIIQEVEGLSALLTEFRTLSRPLEPSPSRTGVRKLVEETIALYRSSHPGISFDLEHLEDMYIHIDRRHIAQALTNLIINGIDAMDGRGIIEIRADLVKKRESRYCRLSIRDTGKGISEEDKPRIFTPYFTTKASGTGLGLPIVERIVNDHGGTIWFNSAPGMGTTFFVDLPADNLSGAAPAEGSENGKDET
jgi:nitrogen fixation/metabolism regulation signal transduction histidine kinase